MTFSRFIILFATLAICLGTATTTTAQSLEERVKALEDENNRLKTMVTELQEMASRQEDEFESDEAREIRSAIESLIEDRGEWTLSGNRLKEPSGFVDQVVWGGEWRTRGDIRVNTTDLISENDDSGFRLDYRFNLGVGFNILGDDVEDGGANSMPLNVKTWFEIQAAGRAANNTALDFQSAAAVSIEDFVTRDNDLDVVRMYQAYILLENMGGVDGFDLKTGRQELTAGSQLLLGTNEFFTGTVHDAVRLDFRFDEAEAEFMAFYAKEASPDGLAAVGSATGGLNQGLIRSSGDEDEFLGLYSQWGLVERWDLDVYYLYFNGRGPAGNAAANITSPNDPAIDDFGRAALLGRFGTLGAWFRGSPTDDLFVSLEMAYQWGDATLDTTDYQLDSTYDAMVMELAGEWNVPDIRDMRGRIYAGYYFAEGPDSGFESGFQPLFISRHNNTPYRKGHGAFSRLGNINMIPTQNIHVFQVGFKFEPAPSWLMGVSYLYAVFHHSAEQFTVLPGFGNVYVDSRSLGHEIDLYATHQMSEQTELFLNLSLFLPATDFFIEDPTLPPSIFPSPADNPYNTDVAFGLYAQIRVKF